MRQFFDVYLFHLIQALRSKGFVISTAIIVCLLFGFFSFQFFVNGGVDGERERVTIMNTSEHYQAATPFIVQQLEQAEPGQYEVVDLSEDEAREAVANEELDVLLLIGEQQLQPTATLIVKQGEDYRFTSTVTGVLQTLQTQVIGEAETIPPAVLMQLQAPVQLDVEQLEPVTVSIETGLLIYLFAFFFYLFALTFGNIIASNIASEKASRVMEVMISKVKPLILMYGKIASVLSLAFIQLGILAGSVGIASVIGLFDFQSVAVFGVAIDWSVLTTSTLIFFALFLLLGFALYAILFAGVGATVSKMEQLGSATLPIVLLAVAAFFIGITAMDAPTSILVQVAAYVPFFTPIAEYARILAGVASPFEIAATLSILCVTIAIVNRIVARLYVNGVMAYHESWSWKKVWQLLKRT